MRLRSSSVFAPERLLCRLIASCLATAALSLLWDPSFWLLGYAQEAPPWRTVLYFLAFFLLFFLVGALLDKLETDSWWLFLSSLCCAIAWLWLYPNLFFSLAIFGLLCLPVTYFVKKNGFLLAKWQPKGRTVWIFASLFGACCAFVIGAIGVLRYLTFSVPNFDFGIFIQMFYNMKQSGLPLCTCERDVLLSHFAVHLSPIYYLLLPFYILFPSPLTLQIGQAVILASGVLPVTLLCRHFQLSGKVTVLVSGIYCFYPALSTGCLYDLHENCFLAPLLLWLFYCFEAKRWWGMYLAAALVLCVKEDAAVYILLFSLYVLLSRRNWRHGVLLLLLGAVYFAVALTLLERQGDYYAALYAADTPNPLLGGPMINRYENLIYRKEDGLLGAIKTALLNPGYVLTQLLGTPKNEWGKLSYLMQMLLPVGFLPCFTAKSARWLLLTPLCLNLLTQYAYQYDLGFQYHFGILAFLLYASIGNLGDLHASLRKNALCVALCACLCFYTVGVLPSLGTQVDGWKTNRQTFLQMEEILDTIPADASVCCSTFLLSHLAERAEVYELFYHGNAADVDYVIFDIRHEKDQKQIYAYRRQGYTVMAEYENLLLILQKGGT